MEAETCRLQPLLNSQCRVPCTRFLNSRTAWRGRGGQPPFWSSKERQRGLHSYLLPCGKCNRIFRSSICAASSVANAIRLPLDYLVASRRMLFPILRSSESKPERMIGLNRTQNVSRVCLQVWLKYISVRGGRGIQGELVGYWRGV